MSSFAYWLVVRVIDDGICFRESTLGSSISTWNDDSESFELFVVQKVREEEVLDGHVSKCVCGFCSLLNDDPLFAMQCAWIRLVSPAVLQCLLLYTVKAGYCFRQEEDSHPRTGDSSFGEPTKPVQLRRRREES